MTGDEFLLPDDACSAYLEHPVWGELFIEGKANPGYERHLAEEYTASLDNRAFASEIADIFEVVFLAFNE